jgi:hypothetical protein
MAVVTGTIYEVDGGHLAGKNPELVFALNDTSSTQNGVYVTEPKIVTPGGDGTWTADLATTDLMRDDAYYTLSIQWQGDDGRQSRIDYPDWCIRVPTGGGSIGDLRGSGSNLSMVYVSLDPPKNPQPFMLWLEQDPDDASNPQNAGNLYRWENI